MLTAGSRTGRLLILKEDAVAIVKETIEIAKVANRVYAGRILKGEEGPRQQ